MLEELTEPRETFYFLDHQLIMNGCHSGRARWQRCIERGVGKGCTAFMRVHEGATWCHSPTFLRIHQPRSSPKLVLLGFYGGCMHRHNWLNHWPLITYSTPRPFSFQWSRGGTKSSNPSIMWLVPRGFPKATS